MSPHVEPLEHRTLFAYTVVDLGTLGGGSAMAHDISDSGYVVGEARTGRRQTHAFRWFRGQMKDLGTMGGTESSAYGVNEAGQVVGRAAAEDEMGRGFFFTGRRMNDVSQIPAAEYATAHGSARELNDAGQIVGTSILYGGNEGYDTGAVVYARRRAGLIDAIEGGITNAARAVNNAGDVVGWSETDNVFIENPRPRESGNHAFLFRRRRLYDLGTLGGFHSEANDISDSGVIVGWSEVS